MIHLTNTYFMMLICWHLSMNCLAAWQVVCSLSLWFENGDLNYHGLSLILLLSTDMVLLGNDFFSFDHSAFQQQHKRWRNFQVLPGQPLVLVSDWFYPVNFTCLNVFVFFFYYWTSHVSHLTRTACKLIHWSLPLGTDSSLLVQLPPWPCGSPSSTVISPSCAH